jgi:DNA polymerase elongation subunit (family B)
MSFSLTETDDDMESLKVMSTEYECESDGYRYNEPVVHCFCRDGDGRRRTVEVEGFYPHFYITESEFLDKRKQVLNGNTIRHIEVRPEAIPDDLEHTEFVQELDEAWETLHDVNVIKIVTIEPEHVGELRDYFDDTFEGDVFFTYRFCISNDIYQGMKVPAGETRVHVDDIEPTEQIPEVPPKLVTVDIEVWSGDGFPEPEYAEQPITSIVAHDNYSDEYVGFMLKPWKDDNSWDESDLDWATPDGVDEAQFSAQVYEHEGDMLGEFINYIKEQDPDLLSGWNSSPNDNGQGFDYPYIINRCKNINVWAVDELSPMEQTFVTSYGTPVVKGRQMFDMLQAYKKTQIHEKRSYALDYISNEELGYGKEDVLGYDEGWLHEPVDFMKYNIRDVQAVVEIEESKSILSMYDHIKSIAGASYSDISDSNIGILDPLFLREAFKRNLVLPTSTKPPVRHYWGAWVKTPSPGKHRNVVYPDLASLYPYLFLNSNMSPETLVGFEDDLEQSEYTEEDCIEMYVDPRDESVKKDVDEPERVSFYVLKPDVKESFVREVIKGLVDMKYEYKKDEYPDEQYGAVKRITNSVYGVMGDSDTFGTGFRLFDWRIAEAITLAGRDVINYTADTFEKRVQQMGYPSAQVIYGDSVPSDEPTIIRRDGSTDIVPIEEVTEGDFVWSDEGFTEVNNVIKKPNRKDLYTVRSQTGVVHTTEDHGLLREDGTEATPEEIAEGDELLHEDISNIDNKQTQDVSKEEAWLLGVFCAEGSAGIYETSTYWDDCKPQVKISNQETELLERAKKAFKQSFSFDTKIYDDKESSNVWNIKPYGNDEFDIIEMAARLRRWCYTESNDKRVPRRIINSSHDVQMEFLRGFHDGDGHISAQCDDGREFGEMWSKSKVLMQGIVYLLRNNDIDVSLSYRRNHDNEYYRTRCPAFRRKETDTCQEVEQYEYDGDYVYDLETENHHFASGIGSLVVHNTDSCVCAIGEADSMQETLDVSFDAAKYVNGTYDEYMLDRFNMDEQDMEVEIERYAETMFLRSKKKRYAEWIRWDEGDLEDEIELTGFEAVRSDSANVTEWSQERMLELLLKSDNEFEDVTSYLADEREAILDGDISLEDLGMPKAISSDPQDYGWGEKEDMSKDDARKHHRCSWSSSENMAYKFWTASPHVRGIRYANEYINGEHISSGDKPLFFYIDGVDCTCQESTERTLGDSSSDTHPPAYQYDISLNCPPAAEQQVCELGDEVDALSVEDVSNKPDCLSVDYERMCEKTLRGPNEKILEDMGWSWEDVESESTQTGLSSFM